MSTIVDGLRNPGWTWDFVANEPIRFANVVGKSTDDGSTAVSLADHVNAQFDQSLSWDDIEWFKQKALGPQIDLKESKQLKMPNCLFSMALMQ